MAENSSIEWCDHTHNSWIGCTKVSPACDNCYAEAREDKRLHRVVWGAGNARHRTKTAGDPVRWNKQHDAFFAEHGRRQRVFCSSLSDVFDNEVDPAWRVDLFRLIASTPNLDWLLLTKRIGNVAKMLGDYPSVPLLSNIWLGATVVNQEEADRDIPKLLAGPARVRFLSIEPMLGPIDLRNAFAAREVFGPPLLSWVIAGAESGPHARPAEVQWFHDLHAQCLAAGVAFHMKQLGAVVLDHGMTSPGEHWPAGTVRQHRPRIREEDPGFEVHLKHRKGGDMAEWPEDLRMREFPTPEI